MEQYIQTCSYQQSTSNCEVSETCGTRIQISASPQNFILTQELKKKKQGKIGNLTKYYIFLQFTSIKKGVFSCTYITEGLN